MRDLPFSPCFPCPLVTRGRYQDEDKVVRQAAVLALGQLTKALPAARISRASSTYLTCISRVLPPSQASLLLRPSSSTPLLSSPNSMMPHRMCRRRPSALSVPLSRATSPTTRYALLGLQPSTSLGHHFTRIHTEAHTPRLASATTAHPLSSPSVVVRSRSSPS